MPFPGQIIQVQAPCCKTVGFGIDEQDSSAVLLDELIFEVMIQNKRTQVVRLEGRFHVIHGYGLFCVKDTSVVDQHVDVPLQRGEFFPMEWTSESLERSAIQ